MRIRSMRLAICGLLLTVCALGQEAVSTQSIKVILRPELVESGFCGVRVPVEGTYYVSVNQLIEIDISQSNVPNCGPNEILVTSDDVKVIKPYSKESQVRFDSGNNPNAYSGSIFKAVKKGVTTIRVKLDNLGSPPEPAIFEYQIVVR